MCQKHFFLNWVSSTVPRTMSLENNALKGTVWVNIVKSLFFLLPAKIIIQDFLYPKVKTNTKTVLELPQ